MASFVPRLLLLAFLLSVTSCVTTWSHISDERVGPVVAEVWRNNKTGKCERRVYMTVMYVTEVNCDAYSTRTTKHVRGHAFPDFKREAEPKSIK